MPSGRNKERVIPLSLSPDQPSTSATYPTSGTLSVVGKGAAQIRHRACGGRYPFQLFLGRIARTIPGSTVELSETNPHPFKFIILSVRLNTSIHSTSGSPTDGVASTNNSVIVISLKLTAFESAHTTRNTVSSSFVETRQSTALPSINGFIPVNIAW